MSEWTYGEEDCDLANDLDYDSAPSDDENATDDYLTPQTIEPYSAMSSNLTSGLDALFEGEPDSIVYKPLNQEDAEVMAAWDAFDQARADEGHDYLGSTSSFNSSASFVFGSGGLGDGDRPYDKGTHPARRLSFVLKSSAPIQENEDLVDKCQGGSSAFHQYAKVADVQKFALGDIPHQEASGTGAQRQREEHLAGLNGEHTGTIDDDETYSSSGSSDSASESQEDGSPPIRQRDRQNNHILNSPRHQIWHQYRTLGSSTALHKKEDEEPCREGSWSSILLSRPHLSTETSNEFQSHHPSTISLSHRKVSIGNGASDGNFYQATVMEKPSPSTTNLWRRDGISASEHTENIDTGPSSTVAIHRPLTPPNNLLIPFHRPTDFKRPSSASRNSPLRNIVSSSDTSNAEAVKGFANRTNSPEPSRPDTPRPSMDFTTSQQVYTRALCPSRPVLPPFVQRNSADQTSHTTFAEVGHDVGAEERGDPRSASDSDAAMTNDDINKSSMTMETMQRQPSPSNSNGDKDESNWLLRSMHSNPQGQDLVSAFHVPHSHTSDAPSVNVPRFRRKSLKEWSQPGHGMQITTSVPPLVGPRFTSSFLYGQAIQDNSQHAPDVVSQYDGQLVEARIPTLAPRLDHQTIAPSPPQLNEPWQEPTANSDRLVHRPTPARSEDCANAVQQSPINLSSSFPAQGPMFSNPTPDFVYTEKRPSDPFAAGHDLILLPEFDTNDSPPLSPLTGLKDAVNLVKRSSRKATGPVRKATETVAVTRGSMANASPRKRNVTASAAAPVTTGVQREGAKIEKRRNDKRSRSTHRKDTLTRRKKDAANGEDAPPVPTLPQSMDVDLPEPPQNVNISQRTYEGGEAGIPTRRLGHDGKVASKRIPIRKRIVAEKETASSASTRKNKNEAGSPTSQSEQLKVSKVRKSGKTNHPTTPKEASMKTESAEIDLGIAQTPEHLLMDIDPLVTSIDSAAPMGPQPFQKSTLPKQSAKRINTPYKRTPRKRKPTPAATRKIGKRDNDKNEAEPLSRPAPETAGANKMANSEYDGAKLTPQATRYVKDQADIQTPLRRSPRLRGEIPGEGL